jgi:SulP family sulfate permease
LFVAATLLFLTPYLYYLPKATLGVIILLAVTGLITPGAIKHAWKANRADGIVAMVTFFVTLIAAPHLDNGIMIGAALAIVLFLYRTMKPRVAMLGRYKDGTLRDMKVHPEMPTSEYVVAVRFDGQLYFANMAYFEDAVLEAVASKPKAKYVLIVGNGINNLDASGEDIVRLLHERLQESGVTLVFSGLKKQVLDVMHRTGLFEEISQKHIYPNEDMALDAICEWLGEEGKDDPFNPCRKQSGVKTR